jgi:hypothetical protein
MRLDRKFLLIAPTLVLVLIAAGLFYTTTRLRQMVQASDNWAARDAFITSVERGQRHLAADKATRIVRISLEAERRQTAAIDATRELLLVLGCITGICAAVLLATIRRVPRTVPLQGPVLFRLSEGSPLS